MTMRSINRLLLASAVASTPLPMSAAVGAQEPSVAVMQAALRSVGRVVAEDCGETAERTATAFVWSDDETLVTARHVVAGCALISVTLESTGQTYTASPKRELANRDLVLLRTDKPMGVAPLSAAGGLPDVGSRLVAIGYPVGVPTSDSKMLDVTVRNTPPGSKLADMLPAELGKQVASSGKFAMDTAILRLDGNLLPGHSGAPLIDAAGNVRAIGSGGLQNGAGGVVWAVRADYLDELAAGPAITSVAAEPEDSNLRFAHQRPQSDEKSVTCGTAVFVYSRSLSLADLYVSSDDKMGLQQLAVTANTSLGSSVGERFDIWVDRDTGASLAVPAGRSISVGDGGRCEVEASPHVRMAIQATDTPATDPAKRQMQVQLASVTFEAWLASQAEGPYATDPSFSYVMPMQRPDGFVVRRVAYFRNSPVSLSSVQVDYAFVTHMARGNRYYGVASIRSGLVVDVNNMQSCGVNPNSSTCVTEREKFRDWSRSSLAVHLATIPPI